MKERVPHWYQKDCREFLEVTPCAGLFLDLGLGKTSIVLDYVNEAMFNHFKVSKTLVIGPKNVIRVAWPKEIRKWENFKDLKFAVLHGKDKDQALRTNADVYLINYDGLKWLSRQYAKDKNLPRFDLLVIDESTAIKNSESQRSQGIRWLFHTVPRKVILTGTPSPNGLIDLYGQVDFLVPGLLAKNITEYRKAYFVPPDLETGNRKWYPRRGITDILSKKMAPYCKVLREDECLDREKAHHNVIPCRMEGKDMKQYRVLEKEFFLKLDNGAEIEVFSGSSLSMKLRQYIQGFMYDTVTKEAWHVNSVKAEVLQELVEAANGKPILCAIQFQHEVDMLRHIFGYRIPAIYGKTTERETDEILAGWDRGEHPLVLIHPASGGEGLNLQDGGHILVWFSTTWDLKHYLQLNGRIDRQGQREVCQIHHLIMEDTVDEVVMAAREDKEFTQEKLLKRLKAYRDEKSL